MVRKSKSFRIYFKDGSYTSNHFDKIEQELDIAYGKVLSILNIPSYNTGIFKYLYEKYGIEKMKLLWTEGFENFHTIYGFSIGQLEADWLNFIKTVPVPKDFDIHKLDEGCG